MAAPKVSASGYFKGLKPSAAGGYPTGTTAGSGQSGAPVHDGTVITDKLKIGSTTPDEIRYGSTYIPTVYKGSTVIWHKPDLQVPSDVILYVPFNESTSTSLADMKVYTSAPGSTDVTENTNWWTVSGSKNFAATLGTNPVGHSTCFNMNGSAGFLTSPSSWLSNMQNITTNITIEYFFYSSHTNQNNMWSGANYPKYHQQGGWGNTGHGWTVENVSTTTSCKLQMLVEWGYQSNRESSSQTTLDSNSWFHLTQGVQQSDNKFYQYISNSNGSQKLTDKGTNANFSNWSPNQNLRMADNAWINGQISELIIRVNRSDFNTIYTNGPTWDGTALF